MTVMETPERLLRAKAGSPALVDVPPARFLMIDGSGSPDDSAFQDAIAALFSVAYSAKFTLRRMTGEDVKVPPLEGVFSGIEAFGEIERKALEWTLLLRLPDPIDDELVERARAEVALRRASPALRRIRVERFAEGECAQVLHVGPYSTEPATVALLHDFIHAQGLELRGRHHEIYLGDPRRCAPERLKTILRQPVS